MSWLWLIPAVLASFTLAYWHAYGYGVSAGRNQVYQETLDRQLIKLDEILGDFEPCE